MNKDKITGQMLLNNITQYALDIVNGEIKACNKHKRVCEIFLRDLRLVHKEKFKYYFDSDELYRFYKWSGMFKHTKGILAGQSIVLTMFQLFVVGNIFCWKRKDNNRRKIRKVYIQLARKNAKSQLLALICSYECFLSKEQQEVYIAGWGRDQSSLVYNEILSQIRSVDLLKNKYIDSYGKVTHLKSGSIIKPLSKEARKTGDGTNPGVAVIDEYHCHETSELYDVLNSGMVARVEPLMIVITTSGFDTSRPCFKEYEYVSKLLDPNSNIENDEYFAMICELDPEDNMQDESNWIKANPIVATYDEGMEFLRTELKQALDYPEKMRNFLTKNMNKWVDMRDDGYMDMKRWGEAKSTFNFELFEGEETIVGIDLAAKLDLTSIGFEFKDSNGIYRVMSHSFIPRETYEKRLKEGKLPWNLWEEQKWITVTPGAVMDYSFIKEYIKDKEERYGIVIKEICYDPWNSTQFAQDMEADGYTMVEIRQGIRTLGEPCKNFREEVYSKNLLHNDNPVLTWAVSNAVTKEDSNSNFMLDKSKSSEKIDPLAALINSHVRAMSVLEDRTQDVFYSPDI